MSSVGGKDKVIVDPKGRASKRGNGKTSSDDKGQQGSTLQVVVKRLGVSATDINLDVDPNSTVLDLKKLIAVEIEESIPTNRHRLIYFGRMLNDDNEVLSATMKSDSINYVHFTPLPKGVKASSRQQPRRVHSHHHHAPARATASASAFRIGEPVDIEARIERARRLGTARRERRRRGRRHEPYTVPSLDGREEEVPEAVASTAAFHQVEEDDHHYQPPLVAAVAQQVVVPDPALFSASAAASDPALLAAAAALESGLVGGGLVSPLAAALQPPPLVQHPLLAALAVPPPLPPPRPVATATRTTAIPTLAQISQLSATISAAQQASQAEAATATTSWVHSLFVDRDRQSVAVLIPSISILLDRLRAFDNQQTTSTQPATAIGEEVNLHETLQLLDHISRETANLASILRTSLLARSSLASSSSLGSLNQISVAIGLEELLRTNTRLHVLPTLERQHLHQHQRTLNPTAEQLLQRILEGSTDLSSSSM